MLRLAGQIVVSMRPKQWTKNLALFVALVFSQNLFQRRMVALAIAGFFVFCLLSGGIYILNDIVDADKDRRHPGKSLRPIASGDFKIPTAIVVFIVTVFAAMIGGFAINTIFGLTTLSYFLLQLGYSFFLKHFIIIDIFCIAASFFIRVIAGAGAIDVSVSSWLLVCTFFISLFMALSKRRHEVMLLEANGAEHRKVLEKYDVLLLDQMISVVTASTVVAYSVYTLSAETVTKFGTTNLKYTIPFVLYGIYRYLYLVYREKQGGSPEVILLTDVPLICNIILYGAAVCFILYY